MARLDSYGCVLAEDDQFKTEIENELFRLRATQINMSIVVPAGDPKNNVVRLSFGKSTCGAVAEGLCKMLKTLPDAFGDRAVIRAVRRSAFHGELWAIK